MARADVPAVRERLMRTMTESLSLLAHRGPDGQGVWWSPDQRVVLGHRRLAIIDLASGDQPMLDWQRSCCVVLNGEIYNYLEIRSELESRRHVFRTKSDTEVLLEAYKEWGERCLDRMNGMFAFAIWDIQRGKLFAARDPLGEKQLYYGFTEAGFVFASEPKAVFPFGVRRSLDTASLFDYFAFRSVPSPNTLFDGIRRLAPGELLVCDDAMSISTQLYWTWPAELITPSPVAPEQELIDRLTRSIKMRLRSDVPVGAFLSGGVDSSLVTALMSREFPGGHSIKTFSVSVEDPEIDEGKYQKEVSQQYGTHHVTRLVTESDMLRLYNAWTDFADDLVADPSAVALYGLALLVREHGIKVVLSGEAADELFGGYGSYSAFAKRKSLRRFLSPLRRVPPKLILRAYGLGGGECIASLIDNDLMFAGTAKAFKRQEIRRLVARAHRDSGREYWKTRGRVDKVGEAMLFDLCRRLPDDIFVRTDRATMAASIESRVPFADPDLVRWALTLPEHFKVHRGETKVLLKQAASRFLPQSLIYRPKIGFDLPIDRWLRGAFSDEVATYELEKNISGLSYDAVSALLKRWRLTDAQSVLTTQVWYWFSLERWYRSWIA